MATVIERSLRETLDGEPDADVSGRIAVLLCAAGRVPSAVVRTGAHAAKVRGDSDGSQPLHL
jgi:hypothetical protein